MASRSFGDDDSVASAMTGADEPLSVPSGAAAGGERRFALLIGNARYRSKPLSNPIRDARLIGGVLRALGFSTNLVENATLAAMRRAIDEFAARIADAGPETVAFVYYAGHGVQDFGANYLLPVDATGTSRVDLPACALPLDLVVASLARAPRKATVLVIDACRDVSTDFDAGERDLTEGLAALKLPPDGMLIVYSTAAGAVAIDGAGAHSPYAEALARSLPGLLEPDRRVHDVFVEVAERVRTSTAGRQNPALYLQGALPALDVTENDRRRFATYRLPRPKRWHEHGLQWVGGGILTLALLGASVAWFGAYPETRLKRLHDWGVVRNGMFEFLCDRSSREPDSFGLTQTEWCRYPLHALLQFARERGRWRNEDARERAERGDIIAMTLLAEELGERTAVDPEGAKRVDFEARSYPRRAEAAGWAPAAMVAWEQDRRADTPGRSSPAPASVYLAAAAGVAPAIIETAAATWENGGLDRGEKDFAKALDLDPTGYAAVRFAGLVLKGSRAARLSGDPQRAVELLLLACDKQRSDAAELLATIVQRGHTVVTEGDLARCPAPSGGEARSISELDQTHNRIEIGAISAMVDMVVILPWRCPGCPDLIARTIPALKASFSEPRQLRIGVMPAYPRVIAAQSLDADDIPRCAPMALRPDLYVRLIETFLEWSALPETERRARLASLAAPFLRSDCKPRWFRANMPIRPRPTGHPFFDLMADFDPEALRPQPSVERRFGITEPPPIETRIREAEQLRVADAPAIYLNGREQRSAELGDLRREIEKLLRASPLGSAAPR
ncbi:caspase domain-containing protein [Methylosinus sp. sav-2]|nr:caspase domain-containing protein [Methylosinus sp. sav-2]